MERTDNQPIALQKQFIEASQHAKGQLQTDVFICYARENHDFAHRLNTELVKAGKKVWFEHQHIAPDVDMEQ